MKIGPLLGAAGNANAWGLRACKNVAIPAGTEKIGDYWFYCCDIESVEIPASVKHIGAYAFRDCKSLRSVKLAEDSRLEAIGRECFCGSGIEEITLPSMLREMGMDAFKHCDNLKTIYVEDGCEASLVNSGMSDLTRVSSLSTTLVGNTSIYDLRKIKDVVIPEGTERIENHWFWRSEIESVAVPASVREIGADAFCGCRDLK